MTGPVTAGGQEFEAKLATFVRENRLYGAAAGVVHGGEVAWSGGAGFADAAAGRQSSADTLYRIASITKTLTGTAIMQLRDAGRLDLDDPAVTWIPELAGSGSPASIGAVTIRRLLSHESGLVSEPPGTDFAAREPVYEGVAARNLDRVAEIYTALAPNTQPKYCNLGYQLLGEIVRRSGGSEYPQFVAERILRPLGMTSTAFEPHGHELAGRLAVGYRARGFSDVLEPASAMPPLWAEGGLWSSVSDLCRWLSFQLSAYADGPGEAAVLAPGTLREMHKPRYLSDEDWTSAWGISWYAVRRDDVSWIQHSGGLPGFSANACFDRKSRVGAVVLVNGIADASGLAMTLGQTARGLVAASAPVLALPPPAPPDVRSLLGVYAPPDFGWLVRLEWRDGKLTVIDSANPDEYVQLEPGAEAGTFVVAAGFRESGEPVGIRRRPDGTVVSLALGGQTVARLDPAMPAAEPRPAG